MKLSVVLKMLWWLDCDLQGKTITITLWPWGHWSTAGSVTALRWEPWARVFDFASLSAFPRFGALLSPDVRAECFAAPHTWLFAVCFFFQSSSPLTKSFFGFDSILSHSSSKVSEKYKYSSERCDNITIYFLVWRAQEALPCGSPFNLAPGCLRQPPAFRSPELS